MLAKGEKATTVVLNPVLVTVFSFGFVAAFFAWGGAFVAFIDLSGRKSRGKIEAGARTY